MTAKPCIAGKSVALVIGTVLASAFYPSAPVFAQDRSNILEEVIVTAQKREQSLQDVPIAVSALDYDTLQANRIVSVADLSGLAPGLTVAPVSGGSKVASFSLRGALGNGVVPGSDRQVSVYLDGVYLSASRGSIFDLPDVERIELLRGPQGTLFGRNATAGGVSIFTRDPTGEAGVKASASAGNYDYRRYSLSVDLPKVGPFSGYVSYVNNERDGDIRNTGAGQLWDRTSSKVGRLAKFDRSPKYLGSEDSDSWFAALKFESGDFDTIYKYDRLRWAEGTPIGTGFVGYDPDFPGLGEVLTKLIESQPNPVPIQASGKRPDKASNAYAIPTPQDVEGHSLTSTYQLSDRLSVKNIAAYRTSFIFGAGPLDGFSSLILTSEALPPYAEFIAYLPPPNGAGLTGNEPPAVIEAITGLIEDALGPYVGSPFIGFTTQTQGRTKQISDEIQFNYDSDFLTATAGALWFNGKDWTGEIMQQNIVQFAPILDGVVLNENVGRTFNEITSIAGYAQLEFHLNEQLDVIAGGRITRDKKTGDFTYGPDLDNLSLVSFKYKKTKPNYLIGVNYKSDLDTLIYGKFSTAYVSGGSIVGIAYDPENAETWEAGIKTELFENKLRANLALFHTEYENIQAPNAPSTPGFSDYITKVTGDPDRADVVGTFIVNQGDSQAEGVEVDITAAPLPGLTLGGSLSYTNTKFTSINPLILEANHGHYEPFFTPEWVGGFWGQYDTRPLGAGGAYLSFRADGHWQGDMNLAPNPTTPEYQTFAAGIQEVPSYWVFNSRIALKNIEIGGVNAEIAAWGKNLTDDRSANYSLNLGLIAAANYIPARTYGVDLTVEF